MIYLCLLALQVGEEVQSHPSLNRGNLCCQNREYRLAHALRFLQAGKTVRSLHLCTCGERSVLKQLGHHLFWFEHGRATWRMQDHLWGLAANTVPRPRRRFWILYLTNWFLHHCSVLLLWKNWRWGCSSTLSQWTFRLRTGKQWWIWSHCLFHRRHCWQFRALWHWN